MWFSLQLLQLLHPGSLWVPVQPTLLPPAAAASHPHQVSYTRTHKHTHLVNTQYLMQRNDTELMFFFNLQQRTNMAVATRCVPVPRRSGRKASGTSSVVPAWSLRRRTRDPRRLRMMKRLEAVGCQRAAGSTFDHLRFELRVQKTRTGRVRLHHGKNTETRCQSGWSEIWRPVFSP